MSYSGRLEDSTFVMAHTVFCLASVYFTAIVGCAFSSPRRTADDTQHDQVTKSAVIDFESVKEFEKQENTKKNASSLVDEDSGGSENTDIGTMTSENETNNNDTINMNTTGDGLATQLNVIQELSENKNASDVQNLTNNINCSNCMTWQEIKKQKERKTVESVKHQILQKLRMKTPPTYSGPKLSLPLNELVSTYVLDEGILEKRREPTHDLYAKNLQLFVMGKDVTRSCRTRKSAGCYFFNVAGKVSPEQIYSAELWIYKLFNRKDPYSQTYLISELGKGPNKKRTPKRDVERIETTLKYGWLKINVKKTVLHWLMKPHRNFGLTILCKFCQRKNHRTIFSSKSDSMPFLVINTRKNSQRQKRSISKRCTEHTHECCLASLDINFSEIGWNWVTAPSSFRANYCTGSCHEQYLAHYNHTQVIQDYRWSPVGHSQMSEVTPCCSPISFSSQSILYIDAHGSIRLAKIPNISATACGCM